MKTRWFVRRSANGAGWLLWLVCAAAVMLSGCADSAPARALRIASASTSMTLCTAAFVSGMNPDLAWRDEVRGEPGMGWVSWALHYDVDRDHQEVRTSCLPFTAPSRAERRGTTPWR